ncbi:NAD(P)-binding domain-containing protein [Salmonella enterica]
MALQSLDIFLRTSVVLLQKFDSGHDEVIMKIGIIGTGMVGRAFATRLAGLGHDVVIGTRNVAVTLARTKPDNKGISPFSTWFVNNKDIPLVSLQEAGTHGELIINATEGVNSLNAFRITGSENLRGKTILDLALPLSYSDNRPPHLSFANDDSLGEQMQRLLPESHVVKSLNTMSFPVMLEPSRLPAPHNVFISGDNVDAKNIVCNLLSELGWPEESIMDLGGIISARGTEMYANLLFYVAQVKQSYDFNISIISN